MKTLVLGIGNPILSDDAIGLRVAREVKKRVTHSDVEVEETSVVGPYLWDIVAGYQKLIIIDSIITGKSKAGSIYRLSPESLASDNLPATSHQLGIVDALKSGSQIGIAIPQEIVVFAIEVKDNTTFSESCSPEVEKAIPVAAEKIIKEIKQD